MEGSGIRRLTQNVLLAVIILVAGCLATACAQSARGAVTASSPSAGAPAHPPSRPSHTDHRQPDTGTDHRQPDDRAEHGLDRTEPDADQLVHLNHRFRL